MPTDYIPSQDADFAQFLQTFSAALTNNPTGYGVSTAMLADLSTKQAAWGNSWDGFKTAEDDFHTAATLKDQNHVPIEMLVRQLAQSIQNNPAVTDEMRRAADLPVYKTTRTPAQVPSTTPTLQKVDTSTRGILRLFIADSTTPEKRSKPAGVQFCEIREQIGGTEPVNPDSMAFLAAETRPPYRADFDSPDVGKTVYFALRWVNTRGEPGPWSQIFSAVVPG